MERFDGCFHGERSGTRRSTWSIWASLRRSSTWRSRQRLPVSPDCNFSLTDCLSPSKGVHRIFGQLSLNKLKILSVGTRTLSEFNLECVRLRAMCISLAARPNFTGHPHDLDCLSTKLLLSADTSDYLRKLFGQCPNLSTIGFDHPRFLKFSLQEVNAERINLPHWRVG